MARAASPFSPRTVLGLVVVGGLAFVAFLWMIGAGMTGGYPNDGSATVGGKGIAGYAALADFLERRGMDVSRVQSKGALKQPGLLVLTPPAYMDGKDLDALVEARRRIGPTLIITPKWTAVPLGNLVPGAKPGWVALGEAATPRWEGFLDDVGVDIQPMRRGGQVGAWRGLGASGAVPVSEKVLSGSGPRLVPLVVGSQDGRILAAWVNDGGVYPALYDHTEGTPPPEPDEDEADYDLYPLVVVFEPDLLNNYGMADAANARLAETLIRDTLDEVDPKVAFDLTLNGHTRSENLLTLAFTPPFLAATLCLLLAALIVGWRAFLRFGPTALGARALAFGKRALVSNAAALIRRTRRFHLLGAPYADAARDRVARALALPHRLDAAATEAAIDRALSARAGDAQPFSAAVAAMRAARRPTEIVRAARRLHSLERILTR